MIQYPTLEVTINCPYPTMHVVKILVSPAGQQKSKKKTRQTKPPKQNQNKTKSIA